MLQSLLSYSEWKSCHSSYFDRLAAVDLASSKYSTACSQMSNMGTKNPQTQSNKHLPRSSQYFFLHQRYQDNFLFL